MELPPPGIRKVSISNPQETPRRFSISPGMMRHHPSMGPSSIASKHSTQSNIRPQSLLPNPNVLKSSLSPPDPSVLRTGSNVSSVRYADEKGKPPPVKATDKEEDNKDKSTGTRLLNILRKTLKDTQSEEMIATQETPNLIPFGDVVGCLAVHIKSCRQFSHRFIIQQHVNLFIRVSINHIMKCTKLRNLRPVNNERNLVLRFDEVKYFSVQVPRRQDDERNNIFLELMQDGGDSGKPALSLGSVESHLYEIIQKGCFTEVLQMKHRNSIICRAEVEFMFSYGVFGYGFSHQLKPLQKIIEPSMFMKISPPPDRTDPVTNVITPQRVEYPAFLSPDLNVSIGAVEASQAVRLEKLQEKPRERLEKMKTEYRHLNTWIEKAEYLRNLITPKEVLKCSKENHANEVPEKTSSLFEEEPVAMTHAIHHRKSEAISNEFIDKEKYDKESLVIPVLKVLDQDLSEHALHESKDSPLEDTLLPPIHTTQPAEEVEHLPVPPEKEDKPHEEKKSVVFPRDEEVIPKRPSILRIVSALQEERQKKERIPHFSNVLVIPNKSLGRENTNQKWKPSIHLRTSWERQPTNITGTGRLRKVAFAQKEYTIPVVKTEYSESKPKHPKLIKGGLDPFLRNINSKMSFKKKKDQDANIYPSTVSTEVAEHEDQDPPYPEHSRFVGSNTTWAEDPNLITIHMVNKNNLPPDHTTTTTMTSDRKNKLPHDSTLNTTNISNTKNIFASDNPVITIAKVSDYKLSTDPSFNTTKPSDTRLPSNSSSNAINPPERMQISDSSSHTAKPSDARLSSVLSSQTTKPSDTRLSSDSSSHTTKPSDTRLSNDPSSNTAKPSDIKLSNGSSLNTAKPSDMRLSSGPSSNTAKPSDMRLSSGPSSNTTKPSDMRLASGPNTAKPSDMRLASGPNTAKPSDMRLASGPSFHTTKPSDTRVASGPSSNTAKPSDTRLASGPNTAKPSDTRLASGPSSHTTQPSGTNVLSHNPSINGNKSSDLIKVPHDPRTISTKSLDSKNKFPSSNHTVNSDFTTNTANTPASRDTTVLGRALFTEDSSDIQSKLEQQLPNVSLPSYQGKSSMTGSVDLFHPSGSINFTTDIEHLKQSIALKSILSKNLQDLSDELFSKAEVCTNTELSGGTQDRVFEKVQDINSWLSQKDILNSQALLSPVIKSVPQDLLPEGGPGTSSDIEDVSDRLLEAAETCLPVNKKSSFKTKHLVSEMSGPSSGLNGNARDYVIKQIFTAPTLSQLETGTSLSEAQMALQEQLFTSWERSASPQILNYKEKGKEVPLSQSKSDISKIMQSFPVETLLESGIIKVIELDKENQSSLLNIQTASPEENLQNPTDQYCNVTNQMKVLAKQSTPNPNPTDTFVSEADYTEDRQSMSAQESKYPRANKKSDLPNEYQSLDTEEAGPSSGLETLNSLLGRLKDTDTVMLKSFLKNIFNSFFKPERREQPEKELDRLIQHSSLRGGVKHPEKNQESLNKADKVDRKPILDPKLCVFLEKLSESEVKNLKSELSKHIQRYLIEKLSEAGHITKEDLPKIYRKLYLMNEKEELKEQSPFQDKYSETVKEIMSFVNNFNHHFIDKHLEIKLRSFLNEILQNYFLKNLSESSLFNETDGVALCPSVSSLRSESTQGSLHGLAQSISSGSFGSRLKINMNYPLNESLQNCFKVLSESELLSLKADLSKYVQVLFIEKLHKSGLMTERQLKGISQQVNSFTPPPVPLKCIKPNLSFRDESYFMREDSEEQMKYPKTGQNTTLQIYLEDIRETELARKQERGRSFPHNLKENPPTIWDHKHVCSREVKTLNLIKVQPPPNKNIQANPLNKLPERPADLLLKKHKKDHGLMQLPQAESSIYKTEIQEPYSWDGRSKTIQSKPCFEKTLKVKLLDKRENSNICKLAVQEKPDTVFSPYLKLPTCSKMSRENEHLNRLSFPTWRPNTFIYVNTENGEQSKLDQYCQRWKGNNNNNKKPLVTFAQLKNEMETLYINPYETCNERYVRISDSQSFKHKENEKNSRSSFFPEVLKRENMKSKRKERDYTDKPKKSFHKIVRILPATLPPTRPHLRKSVPRTLLHWTARRTIHDCLDRCEDLHIPSVKPPKNSKSRARLLGKSPDESHNRIKHCARPYTAPEPNKRRDSVAGKFESPRMVSASLVHIHDTTPECEIRKIRSKRKLKENTEKHPLICDIIRMLDTAE